MSILALDTLTDYCSVALLQGGKRIHLSRHAPRNHLQAIYPLLDQLFAQGQTSLSELTAIAFGCGPGSFTGLRIAASITQSLALVAECPVIAISSLQAKAQSIYEQEGHRHICLLEQAYNQEVYWGEYEIDKEGLAQVSQAERLIELTKLVMPDQQKWFIAGNVAGAQPVIENPNMAESIIRLAQYKLAAGETLPAEQALPVYLRNKESWHRQG